jgi:outer membrane receptor protein involved in Fe transport
MKVGNQLPLAPAATLGTAGIAHAADDQPGAAPSDRLTEIVATATRQRTTVQATPISITAITVESIAYRGIVDMGQHGVRGRQDLNGYCSL